MHSPIVFAIDEAPLSLSVPPALDYIGRQLRCALYEPLVHLDPLSGKLVSGLAARWQVSRNGLKYTFHLQPRRRWSNGDPITAENFLGSLVRAYHHPFWAHNLRMLKSATAEKPFKLVIQLREPASHFLNMLSTTDFAPLYDDAIDGAELMKGPFNGPYALKAVTQGRAYLLEPNPHYPDAELRPSLKFELQRDPWRALKMYDAGKLHVTCNTSFPFTELSARRSRPDFHSADSSIYMQIEVNPDTDGILRNAAFRLALYLALDRSAIANSLQGGLFKSPGFGPRCFQKSSVSMPNTQDPSGARKLLAEVGKPKRPLVIHYNDYYPNKEVVEAIRKQWKEVLDLELKLVAVPFAEVDRKDFDLLLALRFPTFPHFYAVLQQYSDIVAPLTSEKTGREFNELMSKIRKSDSRPALARWFRAASSIVAHALPSLPLFEVPGYWMLSERVCGFEYPRYGDFDFRKVKWKN